MATDGVEGGDDLLDQGEDLFGIGFERHDDGDGVVPRLGAHRDLEETHPATGCVGRGAADEERERPSDQLPSRSDQALVRAFGVGGPKQRACRETACTVRTRLERKVDRSIRARDSREATFVSQIPGLGIDEPISPRAVLVLDELGRE